MTTVPSTAVFRGPTARMRPLAREVVVLVAGLAVWLLAWFAMQPFALLLAKALPAATPPHLANAIAFFAYEVPKVLLLLVLVVFVVGVIRTWFSPERTRRLLAGRRESVGNVLAAALGVVTPFCSCSAVPLFLGFVEAGVPLGVTFSFLISAPMVNEVALVLLFGLFGWKVATLYLATGLLIAFVAGSVLGRLHLERHLEDWVTEAAGGGTPAVVEEAASFAERLATGRGAVHEIVGKVWPYIVGGIAVGAGIHGYAPENLLAGIMGRSAWWSVPVAVAIGVPMYSNAAGIIPVVQALLEKGAALGTVLAFMMSVVALSLPEMIILRKVLRPPLVAAFVGIVALGILTVGYIFNLVL